MKSFWTKILCIELNFSLGWSPLHEACNHGHYSVALTLVKAGANLNAKGLDDDTPLHDAAIVGNLKLVKMLVERGADPCFKNRKGRAPYDVAAAAVYNYLMQARGKWNRLFLLLYLNTFVKGLKLREVNISSIILTS
jgi:ankyrin repeat protein